MLFIFLFSSFSFFFPYSVVVHLFIPCLLPALPSFYLKKEGGSVLFHENKDGRSRDPREGGASYMHDVVYRNHSQRVLGFKLCFTFTGWFKFKLLERLFCLM